jgi:hypothetical protein
MSQTLCIGVTMFIITISRSEIRSILKQAQREQEAEKAGFDCHAEMVAVHRAERRQSLLARRNRLRG